MGNEEPGPKRGTFQFRVTDDRQRDRWQASAREQAQSESKWARDGLDGWATVCARAVELAVNPRELLEAALDAYVRVRATVAELEGAKSISDGDRSRLLRVLAPSEWARQEAHR